MVCYIIVDHGTFRLPAIDMKSGTLYAFQAKAGIIATGGAGRLYNFATYGYSSTPDGLSLAYHAGAPTEDMEFVQCGSTIPLFINAIS